MKILFINNWEIENSLTVSTTFPSLKVLEASSKIEKIILLTPEYEEVKFPKTFTKIVHKPLYLNKCNQMSILKYVCYELKYKKFLNQLIEDYSFDVIIARGAPAGGRAWWLHKKTGIPFYVESFEPHSEYMYESGVWNKYDPRYLIQRYWEKGIIKYAAGIFPVSKNYENFLQREGVDKKRLSTIPCTVDNSEFAFNQNVRKKTRKSMNIDTDAIVGIYVGKFGDIYYNIEAFEAFSTAFELIDNFHLILLSPIKEEDLQVYFKKFNKINSNHFHLRFVSHDKVSDYLSASDFAYSLIKATPSKAYCSPIKVGEYWANGLPIISTKAIGDDAQIIEQKKVGGIYDPIKNNHFEAINQVLNVVNSKKREEIMQLAKKYRNRSLIHKGYFNMGLIDEK